MKAVIVSNGSIDDYNYIKTFAKDSDLIIAADGGAFHLKKMGVTPHILLGDFDSLSAHDLKYFSESGVDIIRFPVKKDMTDTELAVELAISKGCTELIILGGLGSRMDHSMANIMLLFKMLEKGVKGWIINESNSMTVIDKEIVISRVDKAFVSLIPLAGEVTGVTLEGFAYPLDNATIHMGSTWGVSNELASEIGKISIKSGMLLVSISRDE